MSIPKPESISIQFITVIHHLLNLGTKHQKVSRIIKMRQRNKIGRWKHSMIVIRVSKEKIVGKEVAVLKTTSQYQPSQLTLAWLHRRSTTEDTQQFHIWRREKRTDNSRTSVRRSFQKAWLWKVFFLRLISQRTKEWQKVWGTLIYCE